MGALRKSKMLWFNILAILVVVASYFGFGEFSLDQETTNTVITILAGVTAAVNAGAKLKAQ